MLFRQMGRNRRMWVEVMAVVICTSWPAIVSHSQYRPQQTPQMDSVCPCSSTLIRSPSITDQAHHSLTSDWPIRGHSCNPYAQAWVCQALSPCLGWLLWLRSSDRPTRLLQPISRLPRDIVLNQKFLVTLRADATGEEDRVHDSTDDQRRTAVWTGHVLFGIGQFDYATWRHRPIRTEAIENLNASLLAISSCQRVDLRWLEHRR